MLRLLAAPVRFRRGASVSPGEGIAAGFQALRERFAGIDPADRHADYHDRWAAGLLAQRPLVAVSVLVDGYTTTWLMDATEDAAVLLSTQHMADAAGQPADRTRVEIDANIGFELHQVRELASWLHKSLSGEHLRETAGDAPAG